MIVTCYSLLVTQVEACKGTVSLWIRLYLVWLSVLQVQKADLVISSERVNANQIHNKIMYASEDEFPWKLKPLHGTEQSFPEISPPCPLDKSTWEAFDNQRVTSETISSKHNDNLWLMAFNNNRLTLIKFFLHIRHILKTLLRMNFCSPSVLGSVQNALTY